MTRNTLLLCRMKTTNMTYKYIIRLQNYSIDSLQLHISTGYKDYRTTDSWLYQLVTKTAELQVAGCINWLQKPTNQKQIKSI